MILKQTSAEAVVLPPFIRPSFHSFVNLSVPLSIHVGASVVPASEGVSVRLIIWFAPLQNGVLGSMNCWNTFGSYTHRP